MTRHTAQKPDVKRQLRHVFPVEQSQTAFARWVAKRDYEELQKVHGALNFGVVAFIEDRDMRDHENEHT